jgi:hypothetical protein
VREILSEKTLTRDYFPHRVQILREIIPHCLIKESNEIPDLSSLGRLSVMPENGQFMLIPRPFELKELWK